MSYKTLENGIIGYIGNNIYPPNKIDFKDIDISILNDRVTRVKNEKMFYHLSKIDNAIFLATVEYFNSINAYWFNLPLTTLMISSPGEVYAGQTLDYTTDTLPVELPNWFDSGKRIFFVRKFTVLFGIMTFNKKFRSSF